MLCCWFQPYRGSWKLYVCAHAELICWICSPPIFFLFLKCTYQFCGIKVKREVIQTSVKRLTSVFTHIRSVLTDCMWCSTEQSCAMRKNWNVCVCVDVCACLLMCGFRLCACSCMNGSCCSGVCRVSSTAVCQSTSVGSGLAAYFCQCWIDGIPQTLHSSLGRFSLFLLSLLPCICRSALPPFLPLPLHLSRWLSLLPSLPLLLLIVLCCIIVLLSSLSSDQTTSSWCVCMNVCGFSEWPRCFFIRDSCSWLQNVARLW